MTEFGLSFAGTFIFDFSLPLAQKAEQVAERIYTANRCNFDLILNYDFKKVVRFPRFLAISKKKQLALYQSDQLKHS